MIYYLYWTLSIKKLIFLTIISCDIPIKPFLLFDLYTIAFQMLRCSKILVFKSFSQFKLNFAKEFHDKNLHRTLSNYKDLRKCYFRNYLQESTLVLTLHCKYLHQTTQLSTTTKNMYFDFRYIYWYYSTICCFLQIF